MEKLRKFQRYNNFPKKIFVYWKLDSIALFR